MDGIPAAQWLPFLRASKLIHKWSYATKRQAQPYTGREQNNVRAPDLIDTSLSARASPSAQMLVRQQAGESPHKRVR